MASQNPTLKPEQAAVVTALQRLEAHLNIEAMQLAQVYGQEGTAKSLLHVAQQFHAQAERYVADSQRAIVIAHELPKKVNGVIPGV